MAAVCSDASPRRAVFSAATLSATLAVRAIRPEKLTRAPAPRRQVRAEIDAAVEAAKLESPPPHAELTRDIHSGKYPPPRMCNL